MKLFAEALKDYLAFRLSALLMTMLINRSTTFSLQLLEDFPWNFKETFMPPTGRILITLGIPWLFLKHFPVAPPWFVILIRMSPQWLDALLFNFSPSAITARCVKKAATGNAYYMIHPLKWFCVTSLWLGKDLGAVRCVLRRLCPVVKWVCHVCKTEAQPFSIQYFMTRYLKLKVLASAAAVRCV